MARIIIIHRQLQPIRPTPHRQSDSNLQQKQTDRRLPTFHQELAVTGYLPFAVDGPTAVMTFVFREHLHDGQRALVAKVTDLEVLKH